MDADKMLKLHQTPQSFNLYYFQILEEVCKKHGHNVDEYDLKYRNQVLDINTILRFTVIPNNALLEMVPCTKMRSKSTVTVCIQSEQGERVVKEFMPDVTLAEVISQAYPDRKLDETVLTYMHREVFGAQALKDTTLISLGLTHGKAVVRLLHRIPEEISTQTCETVKMSDKSNETESSTNKKTVESTVVEDITKDVKTKETAGTKSYTIGKDELIPSTSVDRCTDSDKAVTGSNTEEELMDTHEIDFLGERNALVFNQAMVQALSRDEFPDSFYELTVEDARVLIRDAKRRREELEEAPLLTNVLREEKHEKEISSKLSKYHKSIIRVQFPDQFVLQGVFQPMETVQMIKDFIKDYLDDPNSDFTIFTAPPKHILDPSKPLIDEHLVPSAIVYYSGTSLLKSEIKEKIVDPKEIEIQVTKFRKSMLKPENKTNKKDTTSSKANSKSSDNTTATKKLDDNTTKTPKWFNTTLKK
ncbi:tether containing UBX domain for GLUT4 isoform X2 [Lasioglossum baleicum]|uniref:tether containing UBX domain for GLUT4 isoform X2 n=1 Tax=Lasioglossum baleicum TaxID=434251 RepID=UPI003FCC72F3